MNGLNPELSDFTNQLENIEKLSAKEFKVKFQGKEFNIIVLNQFENRFELLINGKQFSYTLEDKGRKLIKKLGLIKKEDAIGNDIKSPMPGLIKEVLVKKGDQINKGDALVILEAMKMENILKSPKDDLTVSDVLVETGQTVEKSAVLVKF